MAKRGVSRNPGYKPGSHWAVCDSCGFQFRAEDLKETWDHRWVCDDDWEPRHPQDFLRIREEKGTVDQPIRYDDTSNVGVSPGAGTTLFDINTVAQVGVDTNLPTASSSPQSFDITEDGNSILIPNIGGLVRKHALSTPFDVLSISSLLQTFNPVEASLTGCYYLRNGGTKLYLNDFSTRTIYEYNLSIANDLATAVYTGNSLVAAYYLGNMSFFWIDGTGTHLYTTPGTNDQFVVHYVLSTPFDLSTAAEQSVATSTDKLLFSSALVQFFVTSDGTGVLASNGVTDGHVGVYTMSTPWDVSTLEKVSEADVYAGVEVIRGFAAPILGEFGLVSNNKISKFTIDYTVSSGTVPTEPINFSPDPNDPAQVIPTGTNNNEL